MAPRVLVSDKLSETAVQIFRDRGIEVDFILGHQVAIEVKAVERVRPQHLKGLEQFGLEHPQCQTRILVCLEARARKLESGILILPVLEFLRRLWDGEFTA